MRIIEITALVLGLLTLLLMLLTGYSPTEARNFPTPMLITFYLFSISFFAHRKQNIPVSLLTLMYFISVATLYIYKIPGLTCNTVTMHGVVASFFLGVNHISKKYNWSLFK